jgi:hypothetical protein
MAQVGSNSPHPEIIQESDQLMEDDNSSTPHASTFNPDSRALSVTSASGSIALSRSTSAPFPGRVEKNPGRSSPRHHSRNPTNQTERLKQQIALAFQFISSNIQQSQDENLVALDSLSEDAKTQYANLQLLQTRLAKGEHIVDTELTNAKKALATLEGATHQEQERLKAAIAHEFRRQEQRQQQDTSEAIGRDRILETEVLKLKAQFNEQVKTQDAVWQQVLKEQDDRATELLEQQKAEAIARMERDREEAKEFLERQKFEFQTTIQALTDRIDRAEKTSYTIPPTEAGDGDPGPSNRGQPNPWLPPDGPNPEKQSVSTPGNKGKGVDRGGNLPPPPPGNTGGNPDPDPSDHDDDDDGKKDDDRGRKGGRPDRNARKPSVPRDASPKTRAILNYLQQISTVQRSGKNAAEPPYIFQGDDNQDVRNWLTACEDYFDRNPIHNGKTIHTVYS